MPTLNDVTFDASSWERQDSESPRVWHDLRGDGLWLYLFELTPDIGAAPDDVQALREYYRQFALASGCAVIEVDSVVLDKQRVVKTIIKVPQQPKGMTYVGSFTIPYHNFSFVVKIQCIEDGVTGMRDAVVLEMVLNEGLIKSCNKGWAHDPYDSEITRGFRWNLSENVKYDEMFSDHPLSRLRAKMKRIEFSLKIAEYLQSEKAYTYNPGIAKKAGWLHRIFGS
ncbi:MAG: hypothetical protein QM496_03825 [Verrucomicrobiota bacterium]